ncbi:MAG: hypothetical protein JNJ46_28210 [Myxococcales bacterium]|nr:hypothetical protein [Myxococcales bacterium]
MSLLSEGTASSTFPKPLPAWLRSLLFLLFGFALVAPLFVRPGAYPDTYDFRYFLAWLEAGRRSVLWYGDFPLWNPWTCGGQVYLANPQATIAAPTFVLALLFGTALGAKLMLVTYLFLAQDGMYRLAREHGLDDDAALLAAISFAGCGWFGLHLAVGHLNFAGAALLPYMLLCQRRAHTQLEWAIPLGALMAWLIGLGGTTTPAMATVGLALGALVALIQRRDARPVWALLLAVLATVLIGALRLLPALQFAIDHPRPMNQTDFNVLPFLLKAAVLWHGMGAVAGKPYAFHEYGWKLPILIWPLLLLALRRQTLRARWDLWLVFIVGIAIAAGSALPFGPWGLLKKLPLFRDLRVPSRYILLTALAASLLAAVTAQSLLVTRPQRRLAMWLLFSVFAVESIAYTAWLYRGTPLSAFPAASVGAPFYQVQSHWRTMLPDILLNHGVIGCDEEAPLQRAKELDLGDVPQARLLDPSVGQVTVTHFAPSRIELRVQLTSETLVLLNSNWNEHFQTSMGTIEKFGEKHPRDRDGGRLAVRLSAGAHHVTVRYRPTTFIVGSWLSCVGGMAALALFIWARWRRAKAQQA